MKNEMVAISITSYDISFLTQWGKVRFKFRCNILLSGKIIKEMPGSVASGTPCILSSDVFEKINIIVNISKENTRPDNLLLFNIYISFILHKKINDCI
jgi:hypothetical protein